MSRPAEGSIISDEELPTPDRSVGAITGAVEGHADDRTLASEAILSHYRGDVGVVVLNRNQG